MLTGFHRVLPLVAGVCLLIPPADASAGGGPENVLLVFNSTSGESAEIARFYARLRQVPACNLLGLPWRGSQETISVEEFREALLEPLLKAIEARRLGRQIDYVVYSSGFPWRVRLHGDLGERKPNKASAPFASLTGATYLFQFIRSKSPTAIGMRTNWYSQTGGNLRACVGVPSTPSRGFRAQRFWGPDGGVIKNRERKRHVEAGEQPEAKRQRGAALNYLLSTVLAVTAKERGNTVAEVKAYLRRSALADGTRPDGTFYFARTGDPRSSVRHNCYPAVIAELRSLGAKAEQVSGSFVSDVDDALGLMVGTPRYSVSGSRVGLAPGAIGDNLTSFGGVFTPGFGQTPLTEMLRHGAAGASGAVFEPLAIQAKFAMPTLFLHYRRGCSLAESYYQSVSAPYQLLIVGDPLCQPWADRPVVEVPSFVADRVVTEPFRLKPTIAPTAAGPASQWNLFIDGRLIARLPAAVGLRINPRSLAPGRHELRAVAIGAGPIECQGRWVSTILAPERNSAEAPGEAPQTPLPSNDEAAG